MSSFLTSQNHILNIPPALVVCEYILSDKDETEFLGKHFAQSISVIHVELKYISSFNGVQIQLLGDPGSGKTTFVRGILRGLGYLGPVRSPTYSLVEPYIFEHYNRKLEIYHFDLYRLNEPVEWIDMGFREYFNPNAICLIEWPQKAGALLGIPDLIFYLDFYGNGRILVVKAYSELGNKYLERC